VFLLREPSDLRFRPEPLAPSSGLRRRSSGSRRLGSAVRVLVCCARHLYANALGYPERQLELELPFCTLRDRFLKLRRAAKVRRPDRERLSGVR
jgi:hypothetical protein